MKPIDVALARRIGKETGVRRVIVFFERQLPGGELGFGYASWGEDRRLCASTRKIADKLYDAVEEDIGEIMVQEYERLSKANPRGP